MQGPMCTHSPFKVDAILSKKVSPKVETVLHYNYGRQYSALELKFWRQTDEVLTEFSTPLLWDFEKITLKSQFPLIKWN